MLKIDDDDIFRVFDTGELNHVCTLIAESHDPQNSNYRAILSKSLMEFLYQPIDKFMDRIDESGRGQNASEFDAVNEFKISIEYTSRLLNLRNDSPYSKDEARELSEGLRLQWSNFIAEASAHRMYHDKPKELKQKLKERIVNKKSASLPRTRNTVTKQILQQFKDVYIYENARERGWIKAASRQYKIDRKTVKAILLKE